VSDDWKPHVVQQGEHLRRLAFRCGTDPESIWSNPQNADLAARRKNMDLLSPGDVVYLPTEPPPPLEVTAETTNRYQATIPTVPVKLTLAFSNGPLANQPFDVRGMYADGEPVRGTTSAAGEVALEVPVHVREIEVRLTRIGLVVPVRVGDLDPIEERSGVVQRLRNLGHLPAYGDVDDEALTRAIRAFQKAEELDSTGELDDKTRSALEARHGM
jgi:hypothetical protein